MAEKREVLRLIVGSPGDARAEREAVHRVCDELNRTAARDRGLVLEVGDWDTDAYPGFHPEGPQGLIDTCLRIEDCDVFVGVFWKRFGTPVPDAGSGTEHEIRKAYAAWQEKRRPQIMVYFNEAPYFPQSSEEAKQQLKVLEFREAFPKEGLWWPYSGADDFERKLREHLTGFLQHRIPIGRRKTSRPRPQNPAGEKALQDYLGWVQGAYGTLSLYGLESKAIQQGRPQGGLAEVFVPLTLKRVSPPKSDEVEAEAERRGADLKRIHLDLAAELREQAEPVPLEQLLVLHDRLAVIGGAGSGKSTLLAWLAVQLAAAAQGSPDALLALPSGKLPWIPLLIPLRYLREYRSIVKAYPDPRAGTLAGYLPWYLARRAPQLERLDGLLQTLLKARRCVVFFDGLDEVVTSSERAIVRQQVEHFVRDQYPGNRAVVTARAAGYRDEAVFGEDFLRLDVDRLQGEQIAVLVGGWCRRLFPAEAERRAQELVEAIEAINAAYDARGLPPLIGTPLMTTMVVAVKWSKTDLPRERAKLYEACVEVILRAQYTPDDEARRELSDWGGDWGDQRDWLAALALAMHEGGRDGAAVPESRVRAVLKDELPSKEALDRFVQAVRDRGSLFEERAELFQFTHLSFQEFLAARLLAKRRAEAFARLAPRLADPWWREVILLTHGFAQSDYRPFAGELLAWLSSRPEGDAEAHLAGLELAGAALLELEHPDPEQRRRQAERLAEAFRAPAAPVLLRARSGVTLAQLGDPRGKVRDPDEMQFCFVPSGEFWFGIAFDFEKEGRALRYKLDYGYWMARFPVTNAQFERFVKDGGYATGRFWPEAQAAGVWSEEGIQGRYASSPRKGPLDLGTPLGLANHPIVGVKWYEALAYTRWLTERWQGKFIAPDQEVALPSEPEWEKAARGGFEISRRAPSTGGRGRQKAGCQPLMSPKTSLHRTSGHNAAIPGVPTPIPTRPTMPIPASIRLAPSVSSPAERAPMAARR